MNTMKARSRLKTTPETAPNLDTEITGKPNRLSGLELKGWQGYLHHLPLLLLSLPFCYGVFYILNHTYPDTVANLFIPQAYLPLLLCLFLACYFFFSFIWLHSRRGVLSALLVVLLVFLKLNLVFSITVVMVSLMVMIGYEILASALEKS